MLVYFVFEFKVRLMSGKPAKAGRGCSHRSCSRTFECEPDIDVRWQFPRVRHLVKQALEAMTLGSLLAPSDSVVRSGVAKYPSTAYR